MENMDNIASWSPEKLYEKRGECADFIGYPAKRNTFEDDTELYQFLDALSTLLRIQFELYHRDLLPQEQKHAIEEMIQFYSTIENGKERWIHAEFHC